MADKELKMDLSEPLQLYDSSFSGQSHATHTHTGTIQSNYAMGYQCPKQIHVYQGNSINEVTNRHHTEESLSKHFDSQTKCSDDTETIDDETVYSTFHYFKSLRKKCMKERSYNTSGNRLWIIRIYIVVELIISIVFKYIIFGFHKVNHDEIPTNLKHVIYGQASINFVVLVLVFIFWTDYVQNELLNEEKLLYPCLMLFFLLISDIFIFAFHPTTSWIYLIQFVCDAGYIMDLLFIPIFKNELIRYKESIQRGWNKTDEYKQKAVILIDISICLFLLYTTGSLFLYCIYEDWNIEEIVKDESDAQYANIIIENFLIFEWIHQFIEYTFLGHKHHLKNTGIDLFQCKYLGIFLGFAVLQSICIGIRIGTKEYFIEDFQIQDIDNWSSWLYFLACIIEAFGTFGILSLIILRMLKDKQFYNVFKQQVSKLPFAGVLWVFLLLLQMAYANFAYKKFNGIFFLQFLINLFIYPIVFMFILCASYAFHHGYNEPTCTVCCNCCCKCCCKLCNCWKKGYLYVPFVLISINLGSYVFYGVIQDVIHIHGFELYHLVFMMIVIENSLLLEALHLAFPMIVDPIMSHGIWSAIDYSLYPLCKLCAYCCSGAKKNVITISHRINNITNKSNNIQRYEISKSILKNDTEYSNTEESNTHTHIKSMTDDEPLSIDKSNGRNVECVSVENPPKENRTNDDKTGADVNVASIDEPNMIDNAVSDHEKKAELSCGDDNDHKASEKDNIQSMMKENSLISNNANNVNADVETANMKQNDEEEDQREIDDKLKNTKEIEQRFKRLPQSPQSVSSRDNNHNEHVPEEATDATESMPRKDTFLPSTASLEMEIEDESLFDRTPREEQKESTEKDDADINPDQVRYKLMDLIKEQPVYLSINWSEYKDIPRSIRFISHGIDNKKYMENVVAMFERNVTRIDEQT